MPESHDQKTREFHVRYFASLRDHAGKATETWRCAHETPLDLYRELKSRYGFALAANEIRVAINGKFSAMNGRIQDGDEVVFIPPVSGG